jgi:membrane associated rhomboid family serine protease
MQEESKTSINKKKLITIFFIPGIIALFMILTFMLEKGMDWDFHTAGVYPRHLENIWGIFTFVFIHAGWSHLINNVVSFLILACFLFYFYQQIAPKILILSYIFSGLILWFIGRESWHIGASGLIYALAFFLFFSGIIRKYVPLIAISLIVAFVYGSMVWHIFPWKVYDEVSWEGHLAGGLTGLCLSIFYRNEGPQKPKKIWEDDSDDETIEYLNDDENDESAKTVE